MPYAFHKSTELFQRASRHIAGGVSSSLRRLEQPVPIYFQRGKGCRLWDVDGNEFIDYQLGQGALLFGHAPDGLVDVLSRQASLGTHFAAQCQLEIDVAERLAAMVPSIDLVRFSNSATEAIMAAFRLARAHTGRTKIIRFEGHYHGWSDEGLIGFATPIELWETGDDLPRLHPSQGIVDAVRDQFIVARWGDADHLKRIADRYRGQIAAIVFEVAMCNTCCIEPTRQQLLAIQEVAGVEGALLICDETITGLRFGAGGAQNTYSIRPDLTIFGKAIAGGVPFAVLGGKAAAMEKIASGQVIHAGTMNGNPLCTAASNWCLGQIQELGDRHPAEIARLGKELMRGLADLAATYGIPLRPQGPGQVFHTVIAKQDSDDSPIANYRDYVLRHDAARWQHLRLRLLEEGVRAIERGLWFLSRQHTRADIEETLARTDRAMHRHSLEWPSHFGKQRDAHESEQLLNRD
jgi:glutamate-1-semialdehyde 2,1-aminomutase